MQSEAKHLASSYFPCSDRHSRRISSTNTKRVPSSACTASTNERRNPTTRSVSPSAAWTLFLWPQPMLTTAHHAAVRLRAGPPAAANAARIASNCASGCWPRQPSNCARPAGFRRGAAARGQGRNRIRRALATQELVHKGHGNTEPGGHQGEPGPRFAASGHRAFPQIGQIRFPLQKYINFCTRVWKLLQGVKKTHKALYSLTLLHPIIATLKFPDSCIANVFHNY